jgi:hypothetical protein
MSAPSQSYPQSYPRTGLHRLTITEVEIKPSPVLGKSKIYLFAAAGTVFGILLGVAVASSPSPGWLGRPSGRSNAGILTLDRDLRGKQAARGGTAVAVAGLANLEPKDLGPKDLGSMDDIAAGLKGHLTTNWQDGPGYRLTLEPADASLLPGFAMAVTSSPRPLSVGFELLDSAGAVLCGQSAVVRFDSTRGKSGEDAHAIELLRQEEFAREQGHDIFENEIGDDGQIAAIGAQGRMPCTREAYRAAARWALSADFPSVPEQAELLKSETGPAISRNVPARPLPRHEN